MRRRHRRQIRTGRKAARDRRTSTPFQTINRKAQVISRARDGLEFSMPASPARTWSGHSALSALHNERWQRPRTMTLIIVNLTMQWRARLQHFSIRLRPEAASAIDELMPVNVRRSCSRIWEDGGKPFLADGGKPC